MDTWLEYSYAREPSAVAILDDGSEQGEVMCFECRCWVPMVRFATHITFCEEKWKEDLCVARDTADLDQVIATSMTPEQLR